MIWLRAVAAAIVLSASLSPAAVQAQQVTASGRAAASVVHPLSATALADLSFGAISVAGGQAAGGQVTVGAQGTGAVYTGSVRQQCSGNATCRPHPALFAVSGEAGRSYRVTLPASIEALGSRTGTGLTVAALALLSANRASASGGQLDSDGSDSFTVGGTLLVSPGTPADTYRAEFAVTVSYD